VPNTDRMTMEWNGREALKMLFIHVLHSVDPKLVKMTVGYGISHTATKPPYN
jgi:hypothetical protein